ncbi:DUF1684 domain-containing protein [Streptomyces nojiriensis]|uniref:DUF1684 domain-containing protein n=1 Tax=Streptomyces nojiriensis TaxID=66374 RepID=UPI0036597C6E
MSDDADDPHAAWREWHERRAAAVSAPYGPLALSGTFRLADYPEGRIPAVPGCGRPTATGVAAPTATAGERRTLFPKPGIPDARGAIAVDSHRSPLPPCAFADHFIRPFPPPGNTLPFEVATGERRLKAALATGI